MDDLPLEKYMHKIIDNFAKNLTPHKRNGQFKIDKYHITFTYLDKGGQGIVYLLLFNNTFLVIKVETHKKNKKMNTNELKLMHKASDLGSHHFIHVYAHKIIENKTYIAMERIDGNLNQWLKIKHPDKEWHSFIQQMLYGIYLLQEKLQTFHNDLKPKNIFFKKVSKNRTINILENNVSTEGYLFIIGDFGHAHSLLLKNKNNKMKENEIKGHIYNNSDFEHLRTLYNRIGVSYLIKAFSQKELKSIAQKGTDFNLYLEGERRSIYHTLAKYPIKIKENMVSKSIAYYIIEHDLYNLNEIDNKFKQLILPSMKIKRLLYTVFSQKGPIDNIIEKLQLQNLSDGY